MDDQQSQKPALCYYRISWGEDANINSLNLQKTNCINYAKKHKFDILDFYEETVSGYEDIIKRARLNALLNRCVKDNISNIIIHDLHRLTRSFRDGLLLLDWFHRRGILLHIVNLQKTQRDMDYLDIVQEFVKAERLYNKFTSTSVTHQNKSQMGRPPWGYTKSNGKLKKDRHAQNEVAEIFITAVDRKKENKESNLEDIAKFISASSVTHKKKRAIITMLKNPVYAGILTGGNVINYKTLNKLPIVHEKYISLKNFLLLNGETARNKLKYTKLLFCHDCHQTKNIDAKLHINGSYFRCSQCDNQIAQDKFHKDMKTLCMEYDFINNLDENDQNFFNQIENILTLIKAQTEISSFGYVSNYRAAVSEVGPLLRSYIDEALKEMNDFSQWLAIHYHVIYEYDDQGEALKKLLAKTFERIYVSVGKNNHFKNGLRVKPYRLNGLKKSDHDKSVFESTIKRIRNSIFGTREILDKNPFICDFLAYRIVDERFNQWEKIIDCLEKFAAKSQIL